MERLQQFSHRLLLVTAGTMAAVVATVASAQNMKITHYADVDAGVWYEQSASALLDSGALDSSEPNLRPRDLASRAEVMKMLVLVYGEDLIYPGTPSFDDVPSWAWYYPYVEASARATWVKGDNNCYAHSRPCTARPRDGVNRAEMAVLMQRAFGLTQTHRAPSFPDNRSGMWYHNAIQAAADHCILQGDDGTGNVRPGDFMNRAEMVVMFHRASLNLEYGRDCGPGQNFANIQSVTALAANRVRVIFTTNVDATYADDAFRYEVIRVSGGTSVSISSATVVDSHTVDLMLSGTLSTGTNYRLTASDIRTAAGGAFTDSAIFILSSSTPLIESATLSGATTVRLRFNTDIRTTEADDAFRYAIARSSGTGSISVEHATVVDARTVDLRLATAPASQVDYTVTATDLRTSAGTIFTATSSFRRTEPVAEITSVSALSATRLRLTFNTTINENRSEEIGRYRVSQDGRLLALVSVDFINGTTVEISLNESLQTQMPYVVTVTDLQTAGGVLFSDTESFVYIAGDTAFTVTLSGLQETPPVITTASGSGSFTLTSTGLQYDISVHNLSGSLITGAHFHRGAAGVAGPVIQPITFTDTRAMGTWSLSEQDRIDLLNGDIYVNIHTNAYPNGEIRGQIIQ